MKVSTFGSVVLAAGVLAIGCGCSTSHSPTTDAASSGASSTAASSPAATNSPSSPSTAAGGGAASTPSSSSGSGSTSGGTSHSSGQPGAPRPCGTSSLRVAAGPAGGGAAGSFSFNLTFTNIGSSPCTLYGYPGVSFTTASHSQLGLSAARTPASALIVTLIPNAEASAAVQVPDVTVYPPQDCRPVTASLIKVYPPNQYTAAYVPTTARVCSASTGRAQVKTVVPGDATG